MGRLATGWPDYAGGGTDRPPDRAVPSPDHHSRNDIDVRAQDPGDLRGLDLFFAVHDNDAEGIRSATWHRLYPPDRRGVDD